MKNQTMKYPLFYSLIVLAGALVVRPATADAQGFLMWRAEQGGNDIHLLATVHVFDSSLYPLPRDVEDLYQASDLLIFEVDQDPQRSQTGKNTLMQAGVFPDGETLTDHLPPATLRELRRRCDFRNINFESFSRMRPWMAAINLTMMELTRAGVMHSHHLDRHFLRRAEADGKTMGFLETWDERAALLSGLAPADQSLILDKALHDFRSLSESLNATLDAWKTSDVAALEAAVDHSFRSFPRVRELLVDERNQAWADNLVTQAGFAESPLVVLGAVHFAGPASILKQLEERGYHVTQVLPAGPEEASTP